MTPMQITARMQEPVVYSGDGMHFDGVLSLGAFLALPLDVRETMPPITDSHCTDMDLPLDRWEMHGTWGWKASAVHADWLFSSTHYVRKSVKHEPMARYSTANAMNTGGGEFKSKNTPYQARTALCLVWYAVGDIDAVRDLLSHVRTVGKLGGHGMGRVASWDVEAHDDARAWMSRRLPSVEGLPGAVRAPYWHPSRIVPRTSRPDFEGLRPC